MPTMVTGSKSEEHCGDGVVHFNVIGVGDNLGEHFGQRAGLFADIHHAHHHGGENTRLAQGTGDGFSLFWTMSSRTLRITRPAITLPVASRTMASACKTGTPLASSVPSVRAKRLMASLRNTGPTAGALRTEPVKEARGRPGCEWR